MVRSLSFGSYIYDSSTFLNLLSLRLSIKLKLTIYINLLAHYAKGTLSLLKKLQQIICIKFQVLLTLKKFYFTFPLRYLFAIGY